MDWSVTARTTHPHVRQMIADRELETWLVVDMSASLDFGTAGCEKRDLAVAAAAAITFLNSGGGNRIGALIANGETITRVPARSGRQHEQTLLRTIATIAEGAGRGARRPGGGHRRAAPAGAPPRHGGDHQRLPRPDQLDAAAAGDRRPATRCWASRCSIRATSSCPTSATSILQDAESGVTREFTIDAQLRDDFAKAAAAHRAEVARTLRGCGAPLLTLRTDRDWIADIVRFVAVPPARGAGGAPVRPGRK